MPEHRRRRLLRALASAGLLGAAGCGSDPSDPGADPTGTASDEPTASPDPSATQSVSFSLEAAVESGPTESVVTVSGTVESARELTRVVVEVDGERAEFTPDTSEYELDAELPVGGGRSHEVVVTASDAVGAELSTRLRTGYVPLAVDPIDTDRLVGAHYYPWYEMHAGHQNWTDRTVAEPVLGEYASDDRAVVDRHLKWCLEHGVNWLSTSWWGPDSGSDRALRGTVLEAERFADVQFSILYETVGRLEAYDYDLDREAARERLRSDFAYLAETYFDRENYLRFDGRPVVYFYVSNTLSGDVAGAFEAATEPLADDPYVLAGVPFGTAPGTYPIAEVADGITSYNPYSAREDIEDVFHDRYGEGNKTMHLGAEAADADFLPVVIPGFNDTGLPSHIREDNPVLPATPERYERVCEQVAPHLAEAPAVLVTSFNEWYENTQIEPSEEYGTAYLDLTAEKLATGESPGFDPTGATLRLEFDRTFTPDGSTRDLAFMAGGLVIRGGGETLASFDVGGEDEPLYLDGVYGAASNDEYSWRWFGGADAETTLFVEADLSDADTAVLTGEPMRSNRIEADVYFEGERTDHVAFGERDGTLDDYRLSLTA